ncbi:MAG: sigma-54 dependent transcriptional regulator [Candidatus Wallbacteria bacterium]
MKNILIVDDEKLLRWSLTTELKEYGFNVYSCELADEGFKIVKENVIDFCIFDIRLPDYSGLELLRKVKQLQPDIYVIMITAFAEVETAVEALKLGAYDYLIKPFNLEKLKHVIKKAIETNELKKEVSFLKQKEQKKFQQEKMIGNHASMAKIFELIEKLANVAVSTVLITGESGTGKGLIARAIHYSGLRQNKPFVEINCSTLSESLLESELFGHEKGAFTNAINQKKGLFEIADGGTLFLDEIGEMTMSLQAKLLKVIEDKSFKRVGGVKDISVDVQIVAATNKDLQKEIQKGAFREDLYFRLNVIPMHMPPLRDRIDDIKVLAGHFISYYNSVFKKQVKGLSEDAAEVMKMYRWPGNVRELKNVIERAILLESSDYILPEHMHLNVDMCKKADNVNLESAVENKIASGQGEAKVLSAVETRPKPEQKENKENISVPGVLNAADLFNIEIDFNREGIDIEALISQLERKIIMRALNITSNNQSHTAKMLNLNRDTLRYKMKKLDLLPSQQSPSGAPGVDGDSEAGLNSDFPNDSAEK